MRLADLIAELQLHLDREGPDIPVHSRDTLGALQPATKTRLIWSGQALFLDAIDSAPELERCTSCGAEAPDHSPKCSNREKETENGQGTSENPTKTQAD